MKLKYYLRGLGIGIICTAIIMGIALSGNKKETMTDTEIIERARLLGMVMPEDADDLSGQEDVKQTEDEVSKPEAKGEGAKVQADDSKIDSSKSQTDAAQDGDDKTRVDEQETDSTVKLPNSSTVLDSSKGSVQIEIKQGEYSDTVSQKLFQAGLISDAASFNKYLTQKGADQDLKVGVYQIPAGATPDEIIEILQK